ncbi:uncharacterized protein LOC144240959 isoform X1 [Crocuta crocuta]
MQMLWRVERPIPKELFMSIFNVGQKEPMMSIKMIQGRNGHKMASGAAVNRKRFPLSHSHEHISGTQGSYIKLQLLLATVLPTVYKPHSLGSTDPLPAHWRDCIVFPCLCEQTFLLVRTLLLTNVPTLQSLPIAAGVSRLLPNARKLPWSEITNGVELWSHPVANVVNHSNSAFHGSFCLFPVSQMSIFPLEDMTLSTFKK